MPRTKIFRANFVLQTCHNAHSSTPCPMFLPSRGKLRPWSEKNWDQNSDHPRLCIYWGEEKLRPWSEFLGREDSDHSVSFGCFWGRGRQGGYQVGLGVRNLNRVTNRNGIARDSSHSSPGGRAHRSSNKDAAFLPTVGSFLLTVELSYLQLTIVAFFAYNWRLFAYNFSFLTYNWSFFAHTGKVHLIRALRDCKQRSLTVSKKAPTVSKKSFPPHKSFCNFGTIRRNFESRGC